MAPAAPLRIVFAGTPDFAASSLAALLNSTHQLVGVYTQPDRPAGRGRKLSASPVKQLALEHGIPVYQPLSLKEDTEQDILKSLNADLMVVVAYGLILPKAILEIPKLGCINVHASLLPRWRGAAPIQRAVLAGDAESGVTIMQMDIGLDTGDMLLTKSCPINDDDTGSSLHDRLAKLGAECLLEALIDLPTLQQQATPQDDNLANYADKLDKSQARINWQQSAVKIDRLVRAFDSWPVAFSELDGQRVRIWQATASQQTHNTEPGTILCSNSESVDIACGSGVLKLQTVQLPGAKALPVSAVLNAKQELFGTGKKFS
ncbi:Methionyl-tRNA formyltransferase [gamma proteobacterium IMCC2047]|nr:Methionyl-tRNA formyltransferase [gamma proteobacterium IMCC2047]